MMTNSEAAATVPMPIPAARVGRLVFVASGGELDLIGAVSAVSSMSLQGSVEAPTGDGSVSMVGDSNLCNRAAASLADCGRAAGSFSRSCMIKSETAFGTDGVVWHGGVGRSTARLVSTDMTSVPANGSLPVVIS